MPVIEPAPRTLDDAEMWLQTEKHGWFLCSWNKQDITTASSNSGKKKKKRHFQKRAHLVSVSPQEMCWGKRVTDGFFFFFSTPEYLTVSPASCLFPAKALHVRKHHLPIRCGNLCKPGLKPPDISQVSKLRNRGSSVPSSQSHNYQWNLYFFPDKTQPTDRPEKLPRCPGAVV